MSVAEHLKEAKRRLAQAAAVRRGDDPSPLHNPYTQASVIGQAQGQALVALVEAVQELVDAMKPRSLTTIEGLTVHQGQPNGSWERFASDSNYERAEQRVASATRNLEAAKDRLAMAESLLAAAAERRTEAGERE